MDAIDFRNIRPIDGSQRGGFEEFCCQLARRDPDAPSDGAFRRLRGDGGDGGVECYWQLPSGEEWAYQSKFFFQLSKGQLDKSVSQALEVHPALRRYVVCVPFDLTGPTRRPGKSEVERWDDFVAEWRQQADAKGMAIDFTIWMRNELLERLLATPNSASRVRFWFGQDKAIELDWFRKNISESIADAGPRYSPKLRIYVPIAQCFEALANTEEWERIVQATAREFETGVRRWRRSFDRESSLEGESPLGPTAKSLASDLCDRVGVLTNWLGAMVAGDECASDLNISAVSSQAVSLCDQLESACLTDLGDNFTDTPGWRQFMAEYQCCFPARYLDAARDFLPALHKLNDWLANPIVQLPTANSMLVTGFAGSGKTHTFCDAANQRLERGMPSLLLLGEQFASGEPWDQIRRLLGLGADWSRDDMLTALDASCEASDSPCIIFVDALNETVPRTVWKSHLAGMIKTIAGYPSVKLCISCRTTYLADTIPSELDVVQIDHRGFEGIEDDACFRFFEHYGLEAPAMPLLQPEFSNPLFLRVVCESLQRANVLVLPDDLHGISKVVQLFIDSNSQDIAQRLDFDPREDHVGAAVRAVATRMTELNRNDLPWQDAKAIVDDIWPSQTREKSLFYHLIRNGVLVEDHALANDNAAPVNTIRFAFERVTDHLRAQALIEGLDFSGISKGFDEGGSLSTLVADGEAIRRSRGVLAELSILIPERFSGCELVDYAVDDESRNELLMIVVEALIWRAPSSISIVTAHFVTKALQNGHVAMAAMETLMSLSCRPEHALNADFFHTLFARAPMVGRDSFLCPFFYDQFEEGGSFKRLANWSLDKDIGAVSAQVARLWLKVLAWGCCSSHRRVRDSATKGMIRVSEAHPEVWSAILADFSDVDDEYILERVLLAAYGTLVRNPDKTAVSSVADAVWDGLFRFGQPTTNVVVRDAGRLILEFADNLGVLAKKVVRERFEPPYQSDWPLDVPDDEWMKQYTKCSNRAVDRLHQSCTNDDFEKYTAHHAIGRFEHNPIRDIGEIDLSDACAWIYRRIIDWGYADDDQLTDFDQFLMGKYGTGRGRSSWAERVGKKYQWIALYQLLGHLHDNAEVNWEDAAEEETDSDLQAESQRNIDPTILMRRAPDDSQPCWWFTNKYDVSATEEIADEEWLDRYADFQLSSTNLRCTSPENEKWIVLSAYSNQYSRTTDLHDEPYRRLSLSISGFFVCTADADRFWTWIRKQDLPEHGTLHRPKEISSSVYLGEYPWALSLREFHQRADFHDFYEQLPCTVRAATFDKTIELKYDAPETDSFTVRLPSLLFFDFQSLSWNGMAGYILAENGEKVLECPSLRADGPSASIVKRDFLNSFLESNDLVLFWTMYSERMILGRGFGDDKLGYAQKAACHRYAESKIRSAKQRTFRITPGERVEVK